jgi:hypothetical protein
MLALEDFSDALLTEVKYALYLPAYLNVIYDEADSTCESA